MKLQAVKISIALIFLFQIGLSYAQHGGGGNQASTSSDVAFKFSVENSIGIIRYDSDILFKKLKIKKEEEKRTVAKIIKTYNRKIDKIKFLNSVLLNEVKTLIEVKKMEAKMYNDMQLLKSAEIEAHDKLKPIRAKIIVEDEKLNNQLKGTLSKKQFKRWKKYRAKQKEALKPKAAERQRVNAAKVGAQRNNLNRRNGRRY